MSSSSDRDFIKETASSDDTSDSSKVLSDENSNPNISSLEESLEITVDSWKEDGAEGKSIVQDSKPERGKIFKWFSKSPHQIIKNLKSPKKSAKNIQSRPFFSSTIDTEKIKDACEQSPIPKLEEHRKDSCPNIPLVGTQLKVKIDYENLADDRIIPTFLNSQTCYDIMPTSGKVVVFSVRLLVKNAFEALFSNDLRAAPLWDESSHSFVGMLTITDFINVLRHHYHNAPQNIIDIEGQSISEWRVMNTTPKFVKINVVDNLAMATKILIEEGVHRMPVLDKEMERAHFVLSKKRLLHYIYYNIIEKFGKSILKTPSFLTKSIQELGIGTFNNIAKVTYNTKVIETLDYFIERKVSALPVVDEKDVILDIFVKFDVFALAKEQAYHNLDMTIIEAIGKGKNSSMAEENVYGCTLDDTLETVIFNMVTSMAHRLVVIDEKKTLLGIVSISDILKFLVVQPLIKMEVATDIIEEGTKEEVGRTKAEDSVFLEAKEKCEEPSGTRISELEISKPDAEDNEIEASDKDPETINPVE